MRASLDEDRRPRSLTAGEARSFLAPRALHRANRGAGGGLTPVTVQSQSSGDLRQFWPRYPERAPRPREGGHCAVSTAHAPPARGRIRLPSKVTRRLDRIADTTSRLSLTCEGGSPMSAPRHLRGLSSHYHVSWRRPARFVAQNVGYRTYAATARAGIGAFPGQGQKSIEHGIAIAPISAVMGLCLPRLRGHRTVETGADAEPAARSRAKCP